MILTSCEKLVHKKKRPTIKSHRLETVKIDVKISITIRKSTMYILFSNIRACFFSCVYIFFGCLFSLFGLLNLLLLVIFFFSFADCSFSCLCAHFFFFWWFFFLCEYYSSFVQICISTCVCYCRKWVWGVGWRWVWVVG